MNSLPKVSFLMPTFGRPPRYTHLLEEAVYWVTHQEYAGEIELLVLNDAVEQILVVDHPAVRVLNWPCRVPTLGDKRNLLSALATGDVLLPCDDDDVSLPGRAAQAVAMLDGFEYWNPRAYWYVNRSETDNRLSKTHTVGIAHNASAYRRGKLVYPSTSGNEDLKADAWARARLRTNPTTVHHDPASWQYVYRFNVTPDHISGAKDMTASYRNRSAEPGTYTIRPVKYRDWAAEAAEAARAG